MLGSTELDSASSIIFDAVLADTQPSCIACSIALFSAYTQDPAVDGMPHGEGEFLACTFWLADNYVLQGRRDEAVRILERLLDIRNDVGLLSEEYDPAAKRLLGNSPQTFSHVGLVNTAFNLSRR
jgi:GH15 family glucan-1,4-alpha-glucosidase